MNKSLLQSFHALELQKENVLGVVSVLSPESFSRSPHPGKWSVAEILTHLIVSEQLSLGYMRKKVAVIKELPNSGISSVLRMLVLKISQRIPLKYKAPGIIISKTPQPMSLEEVKTTWAHLREELKTLLQSIEEEDQKKLIFKHPLAGKFNAHQAVIFMKEHTHHHLPQIYRLIK